MDMMTAVATGGPSIQDVDREYQDRRRRVRALLRQLGLEDPNPHLDLWAWYGKWSREFGTYAERRSYVREMYRPLLEGIDERSKGAVGSELPGSELPGRPAVDGQVTQLGIRLASAATPEDQQAVGLLCRDIMISLAQAAHDADNLGDVGSSAVDSSMPS